MIMMIATLLIASLFSSTVIFFLYRRNARLHKLRRNDYIQKYNIIDEQYVFFARGTRDLHKFGLFDVQKIKIQLQPIYDKLEWVEKGKILSATKDGKNFIIDINGNQYS